jgi:hypothetical protein
MSTHFSTILEYHISQAFSQRFFALLHADKETCEANRSVLQHFVANAPKMLVHINIQL